jgi:uncharacterized surface anchored protein
MATSHKSYAASSSLIAHTVLLLELKRVVLLAEENKGTQRQQTSPSKQIHARRHSWRKLLFLALLLFACGRRADAQSTFGSIRGTVQDDSGAVIPGATVAVQSLDQAMSRQTVITSDAGDFLVDNLQPSHYSITVEHVGFAKAVIADAQLDARQVLRIPVKLTVALQTTEVVVSAGANQINTEDATLSDSQDNAQITELPYRSITLRRSGFSALRRQRRMRAIAQRNWR